MVFLIQDGNYAACTVTNFSISDILGKKLQNCAGGMKQSSLKLFITDEFFFFGRYGSELMVVESYAENNMTGNMIGRHLESHWLGLASLDDLRTNTLESAAGMLVSQYAGTYKAVF